MNVPIVEREKVLLKQLIKNVPKKKEFLEIGCGEGHITKLLNELGYKGLSIDISRKAIAIAKKKKLNAEFRNMALEKLLVKKDFAVMLFVLEHIKDDISALKKVHTTLTKHGKLFLSVPAHKCSYSNQDRLAGHYRRYDRGELFKKLKQSGFQVEEIRVMGFPVANVYTWIYNQYLKVLGKGTKLKAKNTEITGIKKQKGHFPGLVALNSRPMFWVLTKLVKLDYPFLKTNLGTHSILRARCI